MYVYIYVCMCIHIYIYVWILSRKIEQPSAVISFGSHENLVTTAFDKREQMREFTTRHLNLGFQKPVFNRKFEIIVLDFPYDPTSQHIKTQSKF